MIEYIILIVVVALVLLGVGGTMLLRPRGMHGVRRSRAKELDLSGSMPTATDERNGGGSGTATATATAPSPPSAPPAQRLPEPSAPTRPALVSLIPFLWHNRRHFGGRVALCPEPPAEHTHDPLAIRIRETTTSNIMPGRMRAWHSCFS